MTITHAEALRALALLREHGSVHKAAIATGIPRHTLSNRVAAAVSMALAGEMPADGVDEVALDRVIALLRKRRDGVTAEEVIKAAGGAGAAAASLERMRDAGYMVEAALAGGKARILLAREKGGRAFLDGAAAAVTAADGTYRFGVATDMHLGSKYQRLDELRDFYRICREEGVQLVLNAGNWIDGEARFNRRDLLVSGLDGQIEYLVKEYPRERGIQTWAVAGDDHEGWYAQQAGIDIGRYAAMKMREAGRDDWIDLGYMERDIALIAPSGREARLRLIHPGGGSAYALSYTMQKLVESYDGGDKPSAIIAGHYHKMEALNVRNVWCVQGGCFQDQTPFMRKKRLAAHVGGVIVTFRQDEETGALLTMGAEFYRYFTRSYRHGGFRYAPTRETQNPPRRLGGE